MLVRGVGEKCAEDRLDVSKCSRGDGYPVVSSRERLHLAEYRTRGINLRPLAESIPSLGMGEMQYVSFHAPSRLGDLPERTVIGLLQMLPKEWPIIVHPEIVETPASWKSFGSQLCLENMDDRKSTGRTVAEMRELFLVLPEASFCLDIGHARQIDPTMTVALLMLDEFADRLVQIHVSEVGPRGEHLPVSSVAEIAFRKLAHRVPAQCPFDHRICHSRRSGRRRASSRA